MQEALEEVQKEASEFKTVEKKKKKKDKKVRDDRLLLTLLCLQGDPYGRGKDYVDIKFKVPS